MNFARLGRLWVVICRSASGPRCAEPDIPVKAGTGREPPVGFPMPLMRKRTLAPPGGLAAVDPELPLNRTALLLQSGHTIRRPPGLQWVDSGPTSLLLPRGNALTCVARQRRARAISPRCAHSISVLDLSDSVFVEKSSTAMTKGDCLGAYVLVQASAQRL